MCNIKITHIWTNEINQDQINDFVLVHKKVFSSDFSTVKFNKKYIKNIFGPSLIIYAYNDNKCIGVRAFWRNDVNGRVAFQPCDTAVIHSLRGKGIFTKMNQRALENICSNELIYNFPNDKSLPGNLKMGWTCESVKRYKLFNSKTDSYEIDEIDYDYMDWITSDNYTNKSLVWTRSKKTIYLLKRRKWNLYVVIGKMSIKHTKYIPKAFAPILLVHSSSGYFGRGLVTVTKNASDEIKIPIYKIDTLFG